MFKVTVKPEIAKTRDNGRGTRNVLVGKRPDGKVMTFSKVPTYLEVVPDEVKADDMLVIVEEVGPPSDKGTVDETPVPEVGAVDTTPAVPVEFVTETNDVEEVPPAEEPKAEAAPAAKPSPKATKAAKKPRKATAHK